MELFRTLGVLLEPPVAAHRPLADLLDLGPPPGAAMHADLFRFQLYPYASVYLGAEGMLGGEARDRIAGFWRALGLVPPAEPDELTVMLAFYAELAGQAATEGTANPAAPLARARQAFLFEHLLPWLPPFLAKLDELAPPYYARWGALLGAALAAEVEAVGIAAGLPLHLREATPLADPRAEGSEAFLSGLLAPLRSGLILVRDDLRRAASELGLGARVGERRFALKALLAQDAAGTLGWLAREAAGWEARHAAPAPWPGEVAEFWRRRATATAALCRELGADACNETGLPGA